MRASPQAVVKEGSKEILPKPDALQATLAPLLPDPSLVKIVHSWWVARRKYLAMPLVRKLRPEPDPDDPNTTEVAFRPREKEGQRKQRSNNKKTFTMMAQLRDEFHRLR